MIDRAHAGARRPRTHRLSWSAVRVAIVAGVLLLCCASASAGAAGKRGKGPLLSPKPEKTYRSHPVPLKILAHRHDEVVVRLNGVKTARELLWEGGGKRAAGLSPNHGLRHGKNVLRVRVKTFHSGRVRKRTIRFRVAERRPLAAAGRDLNVSPGARLKLDAGRSRLQPQARGKRLRYRWKVVDRPRLRAGAARANGQGRRPLLKGRRSRKPVVVPRAAGEIRLRLKVIAPGGRAGTDRITLTADPPPALRVETMAEDAKGRWGIRVGDAFYPAKPGAWLQIVVLDRSLGTLRSNRSYDCPNSAGTGWQKCARKAVDELGRPKNAIVIASNQPDAAGTTGAPHGATAALVPLKLPSPGLPGGAGLVRGTYSAIGTVGGPSIGHAASTNELGKGAISGLLIRNNKLNYTFASPDQAGFDTQAPGSTEDVNVIRVGDTSYKEAIGKGGFHLVIVDRRTLQGKSVWLETHHGKGQAIYNAIAGLRDRLVGAAKSGKIVFLASRGEPVMDPKAYATLKGTAHDFYRLISSAADAIENLGGTRTAFYKLIDPGLYNNPEYFPHSSYTLIGTRSGTGRGQEGYGSSGYPSSSLNTRPLGGLLARTTSDYGFAVDQAFNEDPHGTRTPPHNPAQRLLEVVHGKDTPWPEQGDAGRAAAVAWIGTKVGLTSEPRAQYYTRPYTTGSWTQTQKLIENLSPSGLPKQISAVDFEWARKELVQEIDWLQAVHSYVATLAAPYEKSSMQSWAELQAIANQINTQVQASGDDKAFLVVGALFDGVRNMAGAIPLVGKAFEITNAIYDTALRIAEIAGTDENSDGKFQTTVAKAGTDLADRLRDGEETLNKRFTGVIAADYGKLRTVAQCSLGLSSCPTDPTGWQLTSDQQTRIAQGLQGALRNTFYSTLLPAKYTLWKIPVRWPVQDAAHWMGLGFLGTHAYPFWGIPASAQVFVPYCRDMGDHRNRDQWQVYALGEQSGGGVLGNPYKMSFPKPSVTDPMFAPVDPSKFPKGGLGNSPEAFYLRYFPQRVIDHFPWRTSPMYWNWDRQNQYSLCSAG